MKPVQLGNLNAELPPVEEDLAARLDVIFDRCPQLHGFTVQDSSALPEELRSLALERELVVTDIGVFPFINAEQCQLQRVSARVVITIAVRGRCYDHVIRSRLKSR